MYVSLTRISVLSTRSAESCPFGQVKRTIEETSADLDFSTSHKREVASYVLEGYAVLSSSVACCKPLAAADNDVKEHTSEARKAAAVPRVPKLTDRIVMCGQLL
jgi:hypothetical protein